MELQVLNLGKICRTCKCQTSQMRSLFEDYECSNQSPRIDKMLMTCASVRVMSGDGLPSQICQTCMEQLKSAFRFKRQCEEIDANLREYAKNVQPNKIKQELQNFDFMESIDNSSNDQSSKENNQEAVIPVAPKIETNSIQILDNDQKDVKANKIYKCNKCDKEYTRLNHLRRHENSHSQKKVNVCKICGMTLSRMEHLKRHMLTHLKNKPFACDTCNRVFNRAEHLHLHTPRCKRDTVYHCNVCNKAFKHLNSLEVHKEVHDSQPQLRTIENMKDIEEHYYQIDRDTDHSDADDCFEPHVEVIESADYSKIKEVVDDGGSVTSGTSMVSGTANDNDRDSSPERPEEKSENKMENSTVVKEENISQPADGDLEDSDNAAGVVNSAGDSSDDSTDPEYLPKKNAPQKMKRNRRRPLKKERLRTRIKTNQEYEEFSCPGCQEVFNTATALDKHAAIKHRGMKIHKCGVCSKEFTRDDHLKRHIRIHSAIKAFRCDLCSKGFNRRDNLNQHLRQHNKSNERNAGEKIPCEKNYKCSVCPKSFSTERYRDIHVNGHYTLREFPCKVCEKSFSSKPQLTEHLRFHDKQAKKFLCSECGQRFGRNDYLIVHMRRHRGEKPYICKYCGKGFPRTTDLTAHERYHTGEKNHLCTVCGKGFGRPYNLTVHMRTHTVKKRGQCSYCDAMFAQSTDLKDHMRMHVKARYQCKLCRERFPTGYLLTQHKKMIHGLNIGSNLLRLQPTQKRGNPTEAPLVTVAMPKPLVPDSFVSNVSHANTMHVNSLQTQSVVAPQFHMRQDGTE